MENIPLAGVSLEHFMRGRILSLQYEKKHFPATTATAEAWLQLAKAHRWDINEDDINGDHPIPVCNANCKSVLW